MIFESDSGEGTTTFNVIIVVVVERCHELLTFRVFFFDVVVLVKLTDLDVLEMSLSFDC